uniref:Uncharacterized protein n=1 Tax=Oryza brachyantha TaxID=4533 RepID=J3NEZ3_ORYBR
MVEALRLQSVETAPLKLGLGRNMGIHRGDFNGGFILHGALKRNEKGHEKGPVMHGAPLQPPL